jgi:hypothetical protein
VSDHLPVRVDIRLPAMLSVSSSPIAYGTVIVGATASSTLSVGNPAIAPAEALQYSYTPPAGFTAPVGTQSAAAGATNLDGISMNTATPGAKSGNLQLASNALDGPNATIALSGTVLRHAVASLDSESVLVSSVLDFGTHETGGFSPLSVRVHNQGFDALQAGMYVLNCGITGGEGHFSWSSTAIPFLTNVGATYNVTFDDAGTTADSTYTATFTFTCADQDYPGAQPTGPLTVELSAQRSGGSTTGVGDVRPSATMLYAPMPNPLASASLLRFDLASAGEARLDVFDAAGRRVAALVHSDLQPGRYSVRWDGRTDGGEPLGAGLYFARLIAPGVRSHAVRLAIVR